MLKKAFLLLFNNNPHRIKQKYEVHFMECQRP
nr:MAG TPA: hypothetical protein [Caudoviricetes sp.]